MKLTLSPAKLKILSGLLVNIAAGLILILFTIRDALVLTEDIIFVMLCLILAVKIEEILEG